jgi:hypothetical protein
MFLLLTQIFILFKKKYSPSFLSYDYDTHDQKTMWVFFMSGNAPSMNGGCSPRKCHHLCQVLANVGHFFVFVKESLLVQGQVKKLVIVHLRIRPNIVISKDLS